jgi:hypothetical protein
MDASFILHSLLGSENDGLCWVPDDERYVPLAYRIVPYINFPIMLVFALRKVIVFLLVAYYALVEFVGRRFSGHAFARGHYRFVGFL